MCEKLFELSSDGILLVDPDGKILYINKAYCKQLKIEQSRALGKPVEEIITNTVLSERIRNRDFSPDHNILWAVNPGQYE